MCSWRVCPCGVLPSAAWRAPQQGYQGTVTRPAWRSPTSVRQRTIWTQSKWEERDREFMITTHNYFLLLWCKGMYEDLCYKALHVFLQRFCIWEVGLTRRSGVCRLGQTRPLVPSTSPAAAPAEQTWTRYNLHLAQRLTSPLNFFLSHCKSFFYQTLTPLSLHARSFLPQNPPPPPSLSPLFSN